MLIYILLLACITRKYGREIKSIAAEMLVVLYTMFCYNIFINIYIYIHIYIYIYIYIYMSFDHDNTLL